jgi:hypothetical protein
MLWSPIENPDGRPFWILDGRRRMSKRQAAGETYRPCNVLPEAEVVQFFWMIVLQEAIVQQLVSLGSSK